MSDIKALTQSVYGEMSQDGDIDTIVDTYFAEDFVEHEEIPGLEETGRDIPKVMFRMMRERSRICEPRSSFSSLRTTR